MSRMLFGLMLLLPLMACKDLFHSQCSCTMMACFEGVSLRLTPKPDTTRYRDFSVALAYGDTVEAASTDWPLPNLDADSKVFSFTSVRLRRQRPSHAEVRISYVKDGAPVRIDLDTALAWKARVCNHCSGNSSTCQDDMAHWADVEVDLGPRL